jgi:LacI family transcriptional regulator
VPTEGPATLATVAASAGVSVATVSKVLNGRADVGPETRARVESLLAQHEYVVRRADGRATDSQPTIELVFHGWLSAYSLEIMQGVVDAATEADTAVAVSIRPRQAQPANERRTSSWARHLTAVGRRAVIDVVDDVREGDLSALSRARLPLVVIDPLNVPRRQVTSVGATNFSGGLSATQHLLERGHRRIAYLGTDVNSAHNQARMHGYRAAMDAAGVDVPEGYVRSGQSFYDDGVNGGAVLLDLPERPTAVFAATDEVAAGVIEAARVRGLRVPEDLSVVGFDDTQVARLLSPPLTTVRQPLREMGRVAVRTALRLADGETLESHHVELATDLVVRGSTAPPPVS